MYIRKLTCCCPFSVRIEKVSFFLDEEMFHFNFFKRLGTNWKYPKSYRFSGICSNNKSDWLKSIIRANQNVSTICFRLSSFLEQFGSGW